MTEKKDIVIEPKERVLKDEIADCFKWRGHKKLFSELVSQDIKQCHELVDEWKNLRACYQYIVNSDRYKEDIEKEKREKVLGLGTSHKMVEAEKVKKRLTASRVKIVTAPVDDEKLDEISADCHRQSKSHPAAPVKATVKRKHVKNVSK